MTLKKYTYILLFLFCSFPVIAQNSNNQNLSKKERKQAEKFEKIKTNLENQVFSYSAKWSTYRSRRTKMAQAAYSYIKLKDNTINSSLIYHGKLNGQNVKDLHDSLIQISSEVFNYSITYKDNGNTIIATLDAKQNSEKYHVEIIASMGKPVVLKITSNNREPVTYEGVIR
jgi:hypothetical protein